MTVFTFSELLNILSDEQIYFTFKTIIDEDCYVHEFNDGETLQTFLEFMVYYDLAWISSDKRVLLTSKGEKMFQQIAMFVEINQKPGKIKKNKNLWKTKTPKKQ
jgi:hypothetical protein